MHNRYSFLRSLPLLLCFALVACDGEENPDHTGSRTHPDSSAAADSADARPLPLPSATTRWEIREDFGKYFSDAGVTGAFLLYDPQKDLYLAYDSARCRRQACPASTFKIFNSLVFLETGALRDENEVIRWDSVERSIKEWNRDHTLRSAIEYSVVWFYQELARRVGRERLQGYLDSVGYGNRTIGEKVDEFWLDGSLRISPVEQIDFLARLHQNRLPFSRRTMDIVRDIMVKEKTDAFIYRGKTGWALRQGMNHGWFVGYLERKDGVYFFALIADMKGEETLQARTEIVRNILQDMGLMEGAAE